MTAHRLSRADREFRSRFESGEMSPVEFDHPAHVRLTHYSADLLFSDHARAQFVYVIVFVRDMERSVGFYRDVLEIPLRFATSHRTELATDGATVALHLAEVPDAPAEEPRPVFGARVAKYVDPDGMPFSVGEAPARQV